MKAAGSYAACLDEGRRSLLDDLLVPALQGALALRANLLDGRVLGRRGVVVSGTGSSPQSPKFDKDNSAELDKRWKTLP